ncbi:CHAP domain-containing protein [Bifidobacterium cuniculi]|uniref:Immunogenic secreted protein n=1 Tax=Bifidobacterium cuniculi TaxID=1688 RepID=A0A087B2S3_9BIFI|nr:CHAP domain-containing protein [Bifidobacterium cuniculi]KFI65323.1 Immunogenic secreted protein [Bifidobacterium cuniculi]
MRHAAHKAHKGSSVLALTQSLFASNHGSHTAQAVYAVQSASGNAQALGLDEKVAEKINEIAPVTRRSMREAARAAQRRNTVLTSASLAALVGTAATSMAFMKQDDTTTMFPVADDASTTQTLNIARVESAAASRSDEREALDSAVAVTDTDHGTWEMGDTNQVSDAAKLTTAKANNPKVASKLDHDADILPAGFNANHPTGDTGNAYPWGQCTWWAYTRRAQLGLNTGSYFGDARSWGASAQSLGYWVDNTPRETGDVLVFAPGQEGASGYYGHVAIVEAVNSDGSIRISESNVQGLGVISDREFTAEQAAQFTYVHY